MTKVAILIVSFLALYLTLWPVEVDPVVWQPPNNPGFAGPYATNNLLTNAVRINLPEGRGPEDIAAGPDGWIYGGLQDGRIIKTKDGRFKELTNTGGRPLGLHFHQGRLLVADAYKGLLSVTMDGQIETLTREADGVPFKFTDDLDVAPDGRIYFSDASYKFDQKAYQDDGIEHQPNGRLLVYDPIDKSTTTLLKGLYFANGVAVAKDGSFVLVNETWKYRTMRYWLKGPKKGSLETFTKGLPGFPDGISRGEDGIFWLALVSPRNSLLEALAPYPFARKVIARLPDIMKPDATSYACVLGFNTDGKVVRNLQDPKAKTYGIITSVQQQGQRLWLGSLKEGAIAYYDL